MSPQYRYRCVECMAITEANRTVALRDTPVDCIRCSFVDRKSRCERIPDAPNFSVGGFSAKNGYSKSS